MNKPCVTCAYYDTNKNDQPCCNCYGGLNYKAANGAGSPTITNTFVGTVKDIAKSVRACLTAQGGCGACVFCDCENPARCQYLLAQTVEDKFGELVELLDDNVNHHYYDMLEFYQEENAELRGQLEAIEAVLKGE